MHHENTEHPPRLEDVSRRRHNPDSGPTPVHARGADPSPTPSLYREGRWNKQPVHGDAHQRFRFLAGARACATVAGIHKPRS